MVQVRNAARDLAAALKGDGREREAEELLILTAAYEAWRGSEEPRPLAAGGTVEDHAPLPSPVNVLDEWCERVLKIDGSAQRALHEEVTQLLSYAVQANETEQATRTSRWRPSSSASAPPRPCAGATCLRRPRCWRMAGACPRPPRLCRSRR